VEWIGREGLDTDTHEEYLQHFITHFYKNITKLVDRAMRKEDSSAQGQIVTEILQHLHACNNSVKVICLPVWFVMLYTFVRGFRETYSLHLHFYPEDGDNGFL
jgi:ABC-type long-subunit fatty acid transport system fused permease/ATPase subunit